jgi:hypothetical protein
MGRVRTEVTRLYDTNADRILNSKTSKGDTK